MQSILQYIADPEAVRHEFNAEVNWKDLEETYLYAFEELVKKAKVEGVMGAYKPCEWRAVMC